MKILTSKAVAKKGLNGNYYIGIVIVRWYLLGFIPYNKKYWVHTNMGRDFYLLSGIKNRTENQDQWCEQHYYPVRFNNKIDCFMAVDEACERFIKYYKLELLGNNELPFLWQS